MAGRFEDRAQGASMALVNALVVSNDDPQQAGRVQVRFPHLLGDVESMWLRVVTPAAGNEFGMYIMPEPGDEVVVGFLRGSPEDGVILGSMWNGPLPPPVESREPPSPQDHALPGATISTATFTSGTSGTSGNHRRLWRSRSGALILFDDSPGAESVQLWDKTRTLSVVLDSASKALFLTSTDGDLHIRAGGTLFLEAGQDLKIFSRVSTNLESRQGITYKTGTDVTVEATNITLTATANFEASGSAAKLSGTASGEVSGGARLVLRAGIVCIN